jgi:hypothetical protein
MFPLNPCFVDVSDACHSALTQVTASPRFPKLVETLDKGTAKNKQAKNRLEFMSKNSTLPPTLSKFIPVAIEDHRSSLSLTKPPGRLRLHPSRGEVGVQDASLEYLVRFEV